ncbi:hypothetical protein Ngar_c09870 [Candidatus Nitrososphaera gargensis Ga9.2]|uniref:C2H2-type domain-containing protein n=1 Tax=Nitrososphaera gargensis (strain Ga9.2) TaxID=1237085 RepID=K0IMI8_NITGG|nr:hypothetical protein Ngar_c09870 [Candidatus Nitrososphaera gargensis Ga9.2]
MAAWKCKICGREHRDELSLMEHVSGHLRQYLFAGSSKRVKKPKEERMAEA